MAISSIAGLHGQAGRRLGDRASPQHGQYANPVVPHPELAMLTKRSGAKPNTGWWYTKDPTRCAKGSYTGLTCQDYPFRSTTQAGDVLTASLTPVSRIAELL